MIKYLSQGYTPIYKTKRDPETRATPLVFWSPGSSNRICLTDLDVYQINAGSVRITFGTGAGAEKLFEFYLGASARVIVKLQTPIIAKTVDWPLYISTSVSGGIYVQAKGFEMGNG